MKTKMMYRFVFLFLCVFGFSFSGSLNGQTNQSKLSNEKKQIEKEIAEQKRLLELTQKNKTASLQDIQLITNQIRKQEQLIRIINDEMLSLSFEIEENTQELYTLKEKLDKLIDAYRKAVYGAYKYRNVITKTGFILSSETLTQAARRINYLREYSLLLEQQLKNILNTQQEIKRKDTLLRQNKAEKEHLFAEKNVEKQNLSKQQAEKNQIVSKLKKRESQLTNEIRKRVNRQKQIDIAIKNSIDAEIAAREKQKVAAAKKKPATPASSAPATVTAAPAKVLQLSLTPEEVNLASNFESNKGRLPWPVEKGTIIVNFGTYSHPEVSSVMVANNGINILTEKNASIRAIFDGIVSGIMDVDGAKVLLLRHGNYISVYTNLANVSVKKGDKVSTKQVIGLIKSDPAEVNSEFHFEIRKDRDPLNPSLWIKR